ncbi:hypothetical protein [Aeromicrobium sp.]|uniref:hypothetical protein n=1 Tax=Aeromicrobium sp. TaxID=1871063 RepID=UPI002FC82164
MMQSVQPEVRPRWAVSSSPWAVSVWFVLVFTVFALSAPAFGVPAMFGALLIFRRAHPLLRRIGLVVAITLTTYAVLFLLEVVHFIYWQ